jgi:hypothetical protein
MALDEQLRELANRVPPPPPGDATSVVRRGRRRRRARRAVTVTAAVSVVAVLGVGAASLLDTPPRLPEVADQPDRTETGDTHPAGWVVLRAGELSVSVPPDWQVNTVEPAPDPGAQAGPCAYDLYGGIGDAAREMAAPLAVVYPMETTGVCRAIGLPDRPPEQPSLVLYAGIATGWSDDAPPHDASEERIGSVDMLRLEGEAHEHFAAFQRRDGRGGLLVSHLDDPIVQEVLASLRTVDVSDDGGSVPEDWPTIVAPPSLTLSGSDPFTWAVAVSAGEDDRWCATAARGGSQVVDATGEPCDQLLTPEQVGDPDGFGTGGSEVEAAPDGTPTLGLSWGFAPANADEVFVLFADGTREQAGVATGGDVPAPLWAIGYTGVEVQAVEARRGGEVIAGHIPAISVPSDAATATPEAVFGDSLQRQAVGAFTDEQRDLLDLRSSDELFWLPIEGTADRSVGIRDRDGSAPLMFATDCGLLDQMELPDGWVGLCLEYTDTEQGRVRGLFPHGTTTDD